MRANCDNGFEIYLEDLRPDVQKELLDFFEMFDKSQGNFTIFPIAVIPEPEEELKYEEKKKEGTEETEASTE